MAKGSAAARPRGRPALPPERGKRYAVGIRTTKEIKELLQHAADSAGRSLAAEIEARLTRLAVEEEVLGGPEMRKMMIQMISAFHHAGQAGAARLGHPEWEPPEWIKDPEIFLAAMRGVALSLWDVFPGPEVSFEMKSAWIQTIYSSLASREANKDPDGFARVKAVEAAAARQR
jgi:hypothetical protein